MDWRNRWAALLFGSGYLAIGAMGWMSTANLAEAVPSHMVIIALWVATAILAIGFARPETFPLARSGIGPWLAVSLAAPLALVPLRGSDAAAAVVLAATWPLAALPLGIVLGGSTARRDITWLFAGGLAFIAIGLGVLPRPTEAAGAIVATLHIAAITGTALVPALISARRNPRVDPIGESRVLIGLAPLAGAIVLADASTGLLVLAVALLAVALITRISLRPLTRAMTTAMAQRDLTVAAVEAERERLAANIHDGALQALLILGRQLEQDGQDDAAASARSIAGELRDVAGTLRLPLLDDLGVGAALEWLADRARRSSGADVTVDCTNGIRPPADVELAAFRIAQEAVANAIRHGESPIVIRYRTDGTQVSLSVDDAGRGFPIEMARRSGSHGLLNMSQRAEQIGARLEFLQRPDQGMHVGVEWPATS
jgi:signal transduction histidine kinase